MRSGGRSPRKHKCIDGIFQRGTRNQMENKFAPVVVEKRLIGIKVRVDDRGGDGLTLHQAAPVGTSSPFRHDTSGWERFARLDRHISIHVARRPLSYLASKVRQDRACSLRADRKTPTLPKSHTWFATRAFHGPVVPCLVLSTTIPRGRPISLCLSFISLQLGQVIRDLARDDAISRLQSFHFQMLEIGSVPHR